MEVGLWEPETGDSYNYYDMGWGNIPNIQNIWPKLLTRFDCAQSDIIALPETWLTKHELILNDVRPQYHTYTPDKHAGINGC